MSRNQISFLLGLIIVVTPLSGFPTSWKFYTYIVVGIILMALSLRTWIIRTLHFRKFRAHHMNGSAQTDIQTNNGTFTS